MRLRIVGTSEREDSGYYLRDEFDLDAALEQGFTIRKGRDGYYYGDRRESGGWTARALSIHSETGDDRG